MVAYAVASRRSSSSSLASAYAALGSENRCSLVLTSRRPVKLVELSGMDAFFASAVLPLLAF